MRHALSEEYGDKGDTDRAERQRALVYAYIHTYASVAEHAYLVHLTFLGYRPG